MGQRFVPPLLLAVLIVAGMAAPAAAKRAEVLVDGRRDTEVIANGANARGVGGDAKKRRVASSRANAPRVDNGAKGRRLVNTAKGRLSAKVARGGDGSHESTSSRARSVESAAKAVSGAKGPAIGQWRDW
jgi:hypothetical protein